MHYDMHGWLSYFYQLAGCHISGKPTSPGGIEAYNILVNMCKTVLYQNV